MESCKDNEPNDDAISSSTGKHPLLLPEIVENVVKQLNPSFKQLKTLRLVSKIWTEALLPHWRQSAAVLTFVPYPPFFDERENKKGIPLSEFLTEFQDPHNPFPLSQTPFAKYKLKDIPINFKTCSELGSRAHMFWTLIGPEMKSVHFDKCQFTTPGLPPEESLIQLVVQMIPNLQHLQLTDTLTQAPSRWSGDKRDLHLVKTFHSNLRTLTVFGLMENRGSLSMEDILKVMPGLEVIKGGDPICRSVQSFLMSIFTVRLRNLEQLPRPLSNLKHLDFINSIDFLAGEGHWGIFTPPDGTQLPLETLAIHLEAFREYPALSEDVRKFLKSFSSTLKTLKAFRAPVGGRPYANFLSDCSMTLLTEVYLFGTIAPNFEFLRETPNLKKLRIDLGCFKKRLMLLELITKSCYNYPIREKYGKYLDDMALNVRENWRNAILCTKLEYLGIDFEFTEKSLRMMAQWMPNLRTLKTILNEETVSVVCQVWGDLTELACLAGSKIGNGCFVRGEEEKAGSSGGDAPKLKICDLNDLKRFQLDAYCGKAELTDDVVFNGFLKMTGLKSVKIRVNSQMSKEAKEALKKGIQFCKVVRDNRCAGVDSLGLELGQRSGCNRCDFRRINEWMYEKKY